MAACAAALLSLPAQACNRRRQASKAKLMCQSVQGLLILTEPVVQTAAVDTLKDASCARQRDGTGRGLQVRQGCQASRGGAPAVMRAEPADRHCAKCAPSSLRRR